MTRVRLPALGLPTLALCLTATLALAGCGGDDDKGSDSDTAASTDAGADGGADAGATDTGSASKDTGSTSKDTGGGTQDTGAAPKVSCGDALLCQTECGKGDTKCLEACLDDVSDADKTTLKDIGTCAVDLCKDVTEGTAAEQDCAFAKCHDKYAACGGYGAGSATCSATVACLAGCTLTDFACRLKCMQAADKGAVNGAKAVAGCISTECKGVEDEDKLASCIADKCAKPVEVCGFTEGFGCTDISFWVAKCKQTSQLEPNNCRGIMKGMASAEGRKAYDEYDTCKAQCAQSVNIVGCWYEKCSDKASACFAKNGSKNCQDVDKCVKSDCDGVGGAASCIKACLVTAKAPSQDAFLTYEGCMTRNMDTKEAKTAKCKFPYSQDKCIPVIKGQFCGNEAQNCFTDQ